MSVFDLAGRALRHMPAEAAHKLTIRALKYGLGPVHTGADDQVLRTTIGALSLPNPIGLAAGFDKNAEAGGAMIRAGFGWVECGTVTPLPQVGNARPRLFRLVEDEAVINRMGFNNAGLAQFKRNFARQKLTGGMLGANIGANKDSKDRIGDYILGLEALWCLPDWFTINISSPNTPGLRELQGRDALQELLGRLMEARLRLTGKLASPPFFLKISPDITETQIDEIGNAACHYGLDGLIISNTSIARPDDLKSRHRHETGGLSGKPLFTRSTALLQQFHQATEGKILLVGVGGITSGKDAYGKIRAGASAVQLYTALALQGPSLISKIKRELAQILHANGFTSVTDAVGRH